MERGGGRITWGIPRRPHALRGTIDDGCPSGRCGSRGGHSATGYRPAAHGRTLGRDAGCARACGPRRPVPNCPAHAPGARRHGRLPPGRRRAPGCGRLAPRGAASPPGPGPCARVKSFLPLRKPAVPPACPRPPGIHRFDPAGGAVRRPGDGRLPPALPERPVPLEATGIALTVGGRPREEHCAPIAPEPPAPEAPGLPAPAVSRLIDSSHKHRGDGNATVVTGPTRVIRVGQTVRDVTERPRRAHTRVQGVLPGARNVVWRPPPSRPCHAQPCADIPGTTERRPPRGAIRFPQAPQGACA
jgi:hypothetical protein